MDLKEALKTRRSIRQLTEQPVPEGIIQEMIDYAVWVPNHHVSEPWRFVIVSGDSRQELAQLRYQAVSDKRQGQPQAVARAEKARDEFLQASHIIAVIQKLDENAVRREEDYAAVAMAAYNMMLVAWSHGVGSFWNTGPLVQSSSAQKWLDLSPNERTVAFIRLGYPRLIPSTRRTAGEERAIWRH